MWSAALQLASFPYSFSLFSSVLRKGCVKLNLLSCHLDGCGMVVTPPPSTLRTTGQSGQSAKERFQPSSTKSQEVSLLTSPSSPQALYGYYPANARSRSDEESEGGCCFGLCCCCGGSRKKKHASKAGAVTAVAAADVLTDEGARAGVWKFSKFCARCCQMLGA